MKEYEKNEANLAERIGGLLKKVQVSGVKVQTQTWMDDTGKFYPVIPKVVLTLKDGRTLVVYAKAVLNREKGDLHTRLQFDFKTPEVKPKGQAGITVKQVTGIRCETLPKEVREKFHLPASGVAKKIYYTDNNVHIKYEYAGKTRGEVVRKMLEQKQKARIANLLKRSKK